MARDQNRFLHLIEAPGALDMYKLFCMDGEDAISQPFHYRLTIRSHGEIPPASAWIGQSITWSFGNADNAERRMNGRCASFEHLHQKGSYVEFALDVAPAFESLTLTRDRRIFTDRSAKQVIETVLGEHRISFDDGKYGPSSTRPYIVQHDESDMALVSRLMEEEGVFYFFRYDEGAAPFKHRMILAGDTSGYYDGSPFELSFRRDHLNRGVNDLRMGYASAPAKVVTHDYDFRKPGDLTPVTAPSKLDWAARHGHVFHYGGGYDDVQGGQERAKLDVEGTETGSVRMHGTSSYTAMAPAARFNVDDERLTPRERRIVVRRVTHNIFDPYGLDEGEPSYAQEFEAQPSTQVFRPPRRTPPAVATGPQTAVVLDQVDPEGFGRIKVRFHWDHTGHSTTWVRVLQQWAGNGIGAQFVPRPGMEVLVEFIDGQVDRPVVVGCLYNGRNEHSFAVPANLTQAGWRTSGERGKVNELLFEDKSGGEEIYMLAGRDYRRVVRQDESATVAGRHRVEARSAETDVAETIDIRAGRSLVIRVGDNRITIDAGGIWIDGLTVNLNGGNAPDVRTITSPDPVVPIAAVGPTAVGPAPAGVGAAPGAAAPGSGKPTAKVAATKPVTAMGIDKKFGKETAELAGKSPKLAKDLSALQKDGWTTRYGPAGSGTSANRAKKLILIDKNQAGKPEQLVQSLSHEAGHARYTGGVDMSSKAKYVQSTLADEGAATIANIRARREILATGGKDIGIAGNAANQPAYNKAYDAMLKDGNATKARDAIGAIFGKGEITSTTKQPYADYYGGWYDKVFTPKK